MRQYFEAEMRLLNESAQSFAKAYPELAGLLNLQTLRDRDPTIERLLEGFAYLTAQIRQRIDHELPEISAQLLAQFWPQFLRPYPSATIMQFAAKKSYLPQTTILPAKTLLKSPPLGDEQMATFFSTVFPLKIQPLQLKSVKITKAVNTTMNIHFECDANVTVNQLDLNELSLYLHAELNTVFNLYFDITKHVLETTVIIPDNNIKYKNSISVNPCYLNPQDSFLPQCHRSFTGFSLLLDYFCFREKYFFVAISGLDKINWPPATRHFLIQIHFQQTSAILEHPVSEKNILLNCVPAINLYQTSSEPIHILHDRTEYPLTTSLSAAKNTHLFSVDKVVGIETKSGKQYDYAACYDFNSMHNHSRIYTVSYQDNGCEFAQPFIQLGNISHRQPEILSCQITVCNGFYPRLFLHENSEHNLANSNLALCAYNITRPTTIICPPKRNNWQWLLVSHLSLNYHTLADVAAFQKLLSVYCWSNSTENNRRILAIQNIKVIPNNTMVKGTLFHGLMFCITVDESIFLSIAEIYLFGQILQMFLSTYAQINTYVQLKMICSPSQKEILWDMVRGINYLI